MAAAAAKRSTAEIVLEAVQDLHAKEQIVTREVLAEVTGLKLAIIDDRLSHLTDIGRVRRVQRGVYVPFDQHRPARPISRTVLPDGSTVLEIGDEVIQLTPREARMLGEAMAGSGQQFVAIEVGNQAAVLAAELAAKVRMLEREMTALRARQDEQQMPLQLG